MQLNFMNWSSVFLAFDALLAALEAQGNPSRRGQPHSQQMGEFFRRNNLDRSSSKPRAKGSG
jgi:hypothetical protein